MPSSETCEHFDRNPNNKAQENQRDNTAMSSYECITGNSGSASAAVCSDGPRDNVAGNNNVNHSSEMGNYINVMSVPVGTLQYHRRKLTQQEYPSRLYYNTTEYKCRDELYIEPSLENAGRLSSAPPLASIQFQGHPNFNPTNIQHHPISQQQLSQQTTQHQQYHQKQVDTFGTSHHLQLGTCSSTTVLDTVGGSLNCPTVSGSSRMVATQTQRGIENCEKAKDLTIPLESVAPTVPPIMYTVHRVVTTAQIQTAVGNTFTSSSSVSSVVSAIRNETDIGSIVTPDSTKPNSGTFAAGDISDYVTGIICDVSNNINTAGVQPQSRNLPGKYSIGVGCV